MDKESLESLQNYHWLFEDKPKKELDEDEIYERERDRKYE